MATPISFDEFRTRTLRLYSTGRHAPGTLSHIRQVLDELAALGVATTGDLTTDTMARYVAAKGPTANHNTVNGLLGAAAAACSYAFEEGWLERRPAWRRVRLRPTRPVRNKPRGYEEICRLLADLHDRQRDGSWEDRRICALTWTVALTGLRRNEALYAQLVDVDLGESPAITVDPRRRLKTAASARTVPLPDALAEVLTQWAPEAGPVWLFPGVRRRGPWAGGSATSKPIAHLKRAAAAVGIDRITWHSLRHAFGTYCLERWGLPVWVVQRVMGHTDPRTTELYLHLDDSPVIAEKVRPLVYRPTPRVSPEARRMPV
jgi:integrase